MNLKCLDEPIECYFYHQSFFPQQVVLQCSKTVITIDTSSGKNGGLKFQFSCVIVVFSGLETTCFPTDHRKTFFDQSFIETLQFSGA